MKVFFPANEILYQNRSTISCIDSLVVGFQYLVIRAVSISNLAVGALWP